MDMSFLNELLEEKSPELLEALEGSTDLTPEKATRFLPEAGSAISSSLGGLLADLDLKDLASSANVGTVTEGVDVAGVSKAVGVPMDQGLKGIEALVPMILGFLKEKTGGAGSLLELARGSGGQGGVLGQLQGLGKFLK